MKKLLFFMSVLLIPTFCFPQAAALVHDVEANVIGKAALDIQLKTMTLHTIVQTAITKYTNSTLDMLDPGFIEDLITLKQIASIMESMYCKTDRFNLLLEFNGSYNSCLVQFDFNFVLAHLNFSMDMMKAFFIGGSILKAMASERGNVLKEVLKSLQDASVMLDNLSSGLQINLYSTMLSNVQAYTRKKTAVYNSWNRYTPIQYHKVNE